MKIREETFTASSHIEAVVAMNAVIDAWTNGEEVRNIINVPRANDDDSYRIVLRWSEP